MSNTKSFWNKSVDKFVVLLTFFTFTLFSLFFYLQKIDSDIKNFTNYNQQLEEMASLNHQMENFFLRAYRYINYDEAISLSNGFEDNIASLKKSNIEKEFGHDVYNHIQNVEKTYEKKLELLERFKTLNSRVTNSIH